MVIDEGDAMVNKHTTLLCAGMPYTLLHVRSFSTLYNKDRSYNKDHTISTIIRIIHNKDRKISKDRTINKDHTIRIEDRMTGRSFSQIMIIINIMMMSRTVEL